LRELFFIHPVILLHICALTALVVEEEDILDSDG
jgi:hypothetical protein